MLTSSLLAVALAVAADVPLDPNKQPMVLPGQVYDAAGRRDPFLNPATELRESTNNPCPSRPERITYATQLLRGVGLTEKEAAALMSDSRLECYSRVRPRERMTWTEWEVLKLTPEAVRNGAGFLREHGQTLAEANRRSGVEPEWLVGLTWMESEFGNYFEEGYDPRPVLNALYTHLLRAKNPPPGKKSVWRWWARNLAIFVKQCRERGTDPFDPTGSYAGAQGWTQFMPDTWEQFAVSSNPPTLPNPHRIEDALLSAANYLEYLGWPTPSNAEAARLRLCALTKYNAGPHRRCPNQYARIIGRYVALLQAAQNVPRTSTE